MNKNNIINILRATDNVPCKLMLERIEKLETVDIIYISSILYDKGIIGISDYDYDSIIVEFNKVSSTASWNTETILHEDFLTMQEKDLEDKGISYEICKEIIDKIIRMNNLSEIGSNKHYKLLEDFTEEQKQLIINWKAPLSIKSYRDSQEFVNEVIGVYKTLGVDEYFCSWKYDGFNCATYFTPKSNKPILAHNRARQTERYIDMTELMQQVITVDNSKIVEPVKIHGELILNKQIFNIFNELSIQKFVTTRSCLIAIIHGALSLETIYNTLEPHIDKDCIKEFIHYKTFEILSWKDNLQELGVDKKIKILNNIGLETIEGVNGNSTDGYTHLLEMQRGHEQKLYPETLNYDMDGLVIEPTNINDRNKLLEVFGKNSNYRKAFKGEHWSKDIYSSIIEDFTVSTSRIYSTIKAKIQPIKTKRGYVTIVPLQYKNILEDKIKLGDRILFSDRGDIAVIYEGKVHNIMNEDIHP